MLLICEEKREVREYAHMHSASSVENHRQVIGLHLSESLVLSNLEDNLDCPLLKWSLETEFVLIEAHFLN